MPSLFKKLASAALGAAAIFTLLPISAPSAQAAGATPKAEKVAASCEMRADKRRLAGDARQSFLATCEHGTAPMKAHKASAKKPAPNAHPMPPA
jgi:hypothetical protein